MLLLPRVSIRTVFWALMPYILGMLAIAAILLGYSHFTSLAVDRVVTMERERVVRTAESLIALLRDSGIRDEFLETRVFEGRNVIELSPDILGLFGLLEFQLMSFPEGVQLEAGFLREDSLARGALEGMTAVSAYLERGKDDDLLLYYPLRDSGGSLALARAVFDNVLDRDSLIESRYTLYLMSVAVILLILLPGAFLKLAEIRRRIEKEGFYQHDLDFHSERTGGTAGPDICPPSLLEGDEFPAVFRLDGNGSIIYMNRSAEKLMDITRDDMNGALFHELPCFREDDRDRIVYPREDAIEIFSLNIIDSAGTARRATFVMERLDRTGYAVSTRTADGDREGRGAAADAPAPRDTSDGQPEAAGYGLIRAMTLLKEGRARFSHSEAVVEYFGRLQDALSENRDGTEAADDGTSDTIDISSELDSIASALNDVLPERASVQLDIPDFLPEADCSREDFTQIVKNMVFYSLESHSGPFRIVLSAREVPSPVSDQVFAANCDRTVPRSVALTYTDGTRIPVVLKEALMDPETDLSGIQRDFGTHISSVAAVLSRLECHPVFTEGTMGSSLNILFRVSEDFIFDQSQGEASRTIDLSRMSLAVCEASRAVRDSISDVLEMYGISVTRSSDLDEMREMLADAGADHLLLDRSVVLEPLENVLEELGRDFPALRVILTGGSALREMNVPGAMEKKVRILEKPYSVDEILNIVELTVPRQDVHDRPVNRGGRDI